MNIIENNKFGSLIIEGAIGKKVFFISDLHFHHKNIIKSCGRPFKDVEEMNNTLIDNWNNTVPDDGIVFILGDFCWLRKVSIWTDLLKILKGNKILVMGNHDDRKVINDIKDAFMIEPRERLPVIINGNTKMVLDHFPQHEWTGCGHNVIHLHGHIHEKDSPIARTTTYNVSVERNRYRPINLKEINLIITKQISENKLNLTLDDICK
jgi:calcineurin-like phosphoesterase family protein